MRKQELHPRTAIINKTQKNQSKKARSDALIWLAAEFPAAFDNTIRIRPLKTGIMDDILLSMEKAAQAGISKSKIREAVVVFTRRLDYLACLKAREMRVDLQGTEVGEVTEEEAEHAAAKIKKRIEKSIRNARKALTTKTALPASSASHQMSSGSYASRTSKASVDFVASEDYLPTYPARGAAYVAQPVPAPRTAVMVKHKATKAYDPDAVARLKEKLGLTRKAKAEEEKEMVE